LPKLIHEFKFTHGTIIFYKIFLLSISAINPISVKNVYIEWHNECNETS